VIRAGGRPHTTRPRARELDPSRGRQRPHELALVLCQPALNLRLQRLAPGEQAGHGVHDRGSDGEIRVRDEAEPFRGLGAQTVGSRNVYPRQLCLGKAEHLGESVQDECQRRVVPDGGGDARGIGALRVS